MLFNYFNYKRNNNQFSDSLKYGDYKLNNDEHIIRITQKDICIDAVTFHNYSIQIDFHCLLVFVVNFYKCEKFLEGLQLYHCLYNNCIVCYKELNTKIL